MGVFREIGASNHTAHERQPLEDEYVPLKGYEGRFLINRKGSIYSLHFKKVLKPHVLPNGYVAISVMLQEPRRHTKTEYVHRLIARTFIPNPLGKQQVNHIDGNKQNNDISNLEWCTQSENNFHATRVLRHRRNVSKLLEYNSNKRKIPVWLVVELRKCKTPNDAYRIVRDNGILASYSSVYHIYIGKTYKDIREK